MTDFNNFGFRNQGVYVYIIIPSPNNCVNASKKNLCKCNKKVKFYNYWLNHVLKEIKDLVHSYIYRSTTHCQNGINSTCAYVGFEVILIRK